MRDPLMPPVLILSGAALLFWGGLKLRRVLATPDSEFCANERLGRQHKIEGLIMRLAHALDTVGVLLVGVFVFAFGFVALLG